MPKDEPIPQDKERFRFLANVPKAQIPPGHTAPLDFKPTRSLIRERQKALKNSTAIAQVIE